MSEKKLESKEVLEETTQENLEEIAPTNPLVYKLCKPIDHFQNHIEYLDMREMENLNLKDMEKIQARYNLLGGTGAVMQETNPLFIKLLLSEGTGYPIEVIEQISAKDTAKLKNRIFLFFYGAA